MKRTSLPWKKIGLFIGAIAIVACAGVLLSIRYSAGFRAFVSITEGSQVEGVGIVERIKLAPLAEMEGTSNRVRFSANLTGDEGRRRVEVVMKKESDGRWIVESMK